MCIIFLTANNSGVKNAVSSDDCTAIKAKKNFESGRKGLRTDKDSVHFDQFVHRHLVAAGVLGDIEPLVGYLI